MEKDYNIMFAGPSGVGKTTLAKHVSSYSYDQMVSKFPDIEFISGSVSDLLVNTKDMSHQDMLSRDPKDLALEDYQVLNLRHKKFSSSEGLPLHNFVSDRSFLDVAAYFWYKQSANMPACELEHFLDISKSMCILHCTHLILLDFTLPMIKEWAIEDNNKRITSGYFQYHISQIMKMVLKVWGYKIDYTIDNLNNGKWLSTIPLKQGAEVGKISSVMGSTKILTIRECDLDIRKRLIENFIHGKI